jgi:ribonucleoside-diphosphate reductase alpha chain
MAISKNAHLVLKQRYCQGNEQPKDVYYRVASALSMGDTKFRNALYGGMYKGILMPASPTLRNAGFKQRVLHPCACLSIEDNIPSIFKTLSDVGVLFQHGAGVGINFSTLRPKGDKLSRGGETTGVLSFLRLFDYVTETVKQGGFRKGGILGILDDNHPEILSFIAAKLKGGFTNCNLSVLITKEFMAAVDNDTPWELKFNGKIYDVVQARYLFEMMCLAAHQCGCPGLLFYDRINKDNPYFPDLKLKTANLCAELPLPDGTMCNLVSINVSRFVKRNKFDASGFAQYVRLATRAALAINGVGWFPLQEIAANMAKYQPIGVGIAGMADLLIKLGIYYDSDDHLKLIDELKVPYIHITNKIAPHSFYKRSLPPTGTCSLLLDCSPATEPVFDSVFERHLTVGVLEETRELYKSKHVRTAHQISPDWRLKIQAKWQNEVVDSGISSTVNLPRSTSLKAVEDIYRKAFSMGLKGITVWRDECRDEQVMRRKTCDETTGECHL